MENHSLISSAMGAIALLTVVLAFPQAPDIAGLGALLGFGAVAFATVGLKRSAKSVWAGTLGIVMGGASMLLSMLLLAYLSGYQ